MFTAVETEQGPVGIPGTEAFLSGISWSKDSSLQELPCVPKDGFQQLLIKGGTAKTPPEARLKGLEKLTKIRRPDHLRWRVCSPCSYPDLVRDHSFDPLLITLSKNKTNKQKNHSHQGFPGGAVDKNPPANEGNTGSISGQGRFHMVQSN